MVNETKREYVFLDNGINEEISWVFRMGWDPTDKVCIVNTFSDGIDLDDDYVQLGLIDGVCVKRWG